VSRRGWVLFVAMSIIWGVPYLLIKVADGGVAVPVLVFCRVAVGATLLLPVALRRRQVRPLLGHWRWLLLFAFVEIILPWLLLSDAERRLTSSMSGLLIASVPIIGLVLARATGGPERLTAVRWVGLLAGVAGVGLLAGPGALGGGAWPVTEVMLVALGYASGPLIASRKLNGLPGLGVTAVCLGLATLVYAPAAALTWPSALPSASVLAALATLGALCTASALLLFFLLIAEVGPARATVITYVNPAVAVALGVAVLHEPFTPEIAAAFALILAGSVMATRSGIRPGRRGGVRHVLQPDGGDLRAQADEVREPLALRPTGVKPWPAGRFRTGTRGPCRRPSPGRTHKRRCCPW
jgi:drug/metabolite transporter (DMT)-like permease